MMNGKKSSRFFAAPGGLTLTFRFFDRDFVRRGVDEMPF
jgi:hypothetical protein